MPLFDHSVPDYRCRNCESYWDVNRLYCPRCHYSTVEPNPDTEPTRAQTVEPPVCDACKKPKEFIEDDRMEGEYAYRCTNHMCPNDREP